MTPTPFVKGNFCMEVQCWQCDCQRGGWGLGGEQLELVSQGKKKKNTSNLDWEKVGKRGLCFALS